MRSDIKKTKFDTFIDDKYINIDTKTKIIIIVVSLIIPTLIFYFLLFNPNFEKITTLQQQVNTNRAELNKVKNIARNLAKYKKDFEQTQEIFESMAILLPKTQEIPNLLRDISDLGRNTGLDFMTFVPGPEVLKDFYAEIPIDITIKGPYHNIGSFLDKVSKLDRIVTVNNIKIDKPETEGSEMVLNSTCRLVTYRFTNKKIEPNEKNTIKGKK